MAGRSWATSEARPWAEGFVFFLFSSGTLERFVTAARFRTRCGRSAVHVFMSCWVSCSELGCIWASTSPSSPCRYCELARHLLLSSSGPQKFGLVAVALFWRETQKRGQRNRNGRIGANKDQDQIQETVTLHSQNASRSRYCLLSHDIASLLIHVIVFVKLLRLGDEEGAHPTLSSNK